MKFLRLIVPLILALSACSSKKTEPLPEIPVIKLAQPAATPTPCVDTLAAPQYPKELQAIPLNYAIGGFAKTFGDFFPVAKKELDRGRKYIRVNLQWCDNHNCWDIKGAEKEARRYQILCRAFPDRIIEISPFTEHNLPSSKLDKYLDTIQANAPNCRVINTPWKGALSKKYKNEIHGNHSIPPGPYNYSYDGTNTVDSDVKADLQKHSRAELFCVWHPRLNLKYSMKDPAGRPQRIKEAKVRSPNKDFLLSLVYLFTEKGPFNIPKNWLVKSHAERHQAVDSKGDKLLIIAPIRADAVTLKRAGREVAKLPYYAPFDGGGFRYYWNKLAYHAGRSLDVFIGKKQYGTINPGFRGPTFRD